MGESVRRGELILLFYNFEDFSDKSEAKKCKRDAEELEDGEITDSDEDDEPTKTSNSEHPRIVALPSDDDLEVMDMKPLIRVVNPNENVTNSGICKFFARGNCTWGDNCKYKHSKVGDKQI